MPNQQINNYATILGIIIVVIVILLIALVVVYFMSRNKKEKKQKTPSEARTAFRAVKQAHGTPVPQGRGAEKREETKNAV